MKLVHKGQIPTNLNALIEYAKSPEGRERSRKRNLGKKLSEETKEKIRKGNKGISKQTPKYWTGKHLPDYMKKKISKANMGKRNSPRTEFKRLKPKNFFKDKYYSSKWLRLAKAIRKRDNYTCQQCGKQPVYDVHHLIPFRLSYNDNENNLVTSCKSCHAIMEYTIRFKKGG